MTGWRIGYGGGPEPLIKAMAKLQSQSTSNPLSISQWAARRGAERPAGLHRRQHRVFKARRDLVVSMLNQAKRHLPARRRRAPSTSIPSCAGPIGKTSAERARSSATTRTSPPSCSRRKGSRWSTARPSACRPASASATPPPRRRSRTPAAGPAVLCRFALTKRGTGRDVMRDGARLTKRWVLAAAAAVLAALPAAAQSGVNIGTLTCNVSGGVGYIITSAKSMACTFSSPSFPPQHYSGVAMKVCDVSRRGRAPRGR